MRGVVDHQVEPLVAELVVHDGGQRRPVGLVDAVVRPQHGVEGPLGDEPVEQLHRLAQVDHDDPGRLGDQGHERRAATLEDAELDDVALGPLGECEVVPREVVRLGQVEGIVGGRAIGAPELESHPVDLQNVVAQEHLVVLFSDDGDQALGSTERLGRRRPPVRRPLVRREDVGGSRP